VRLKEQRVHRNEQQIDEVRSCGVQRENDGTPSFVEAFFEKRQIALALRTKRRHSEAAVDGLDDLVDQIQGDEEPKDDASVAREQHTAESGNFKRKQCSEDELLDALVSQLVNDGRQVRSAILIRRVKLVR
jgi:hypothetical protein